MVWKVAKRCKAIIMTKSTSFEEPFLLWRVCVKKQNEEVLREKINFNKLLCMLKACVNLDSKYNV